MRLAIIILALVITTFSFFSAEAMAEEEIYRWVDENGVVHFGGLPPIETNAEQISIPTSKISDTPYSADPAPADADAPLGPQPSVAQQLRDERAEKRAEAAEKNREIAEACEQRRTIVSQLEPSTRVMVTSEDGTVTRMDDDVRLETLNEAKTYIARNCNN